MFVGSVRSCRIDVSDCLRVYVELRLPGVVVLQGPAAAVCLWLNIGPSLQSILG